MITKAMVASINVLCFAFSTILLFASAAGDNLACTALPGGTVVQVDESCFYIREKGTLNRQASENECIQLGPRPYVWHLPQLETKKKNDEVTAVVSHHTLKKDWAMWIGLFRLDPTETEKTNNILWANPSKWVWTSDHKTLRTTSFTSWGPHEPNNVGNANDLASMERCVTLGNSGHWNDLKCEIGERNYHAPLLIFVCESAAIATTSATLTSTSTTTITATSAIPNTSEQVTSSAAATFANITTNGTTEITDVVSAAKTTISNEQIELGKTSNENENDLQWQFIVVAIFVGVACFITLLICAAIIIGVCYVKRRRVKSEHATLSFSLNSLVSQPSERPQTNLNN